MTSMTEEMDVSFYLILILKPRFDPAIGKLFSVFRTQSCELAFLLNLNPDQIFLMKIWHLNSLYAVSEKYTQNFHNLVQIKKDPIHLINNFYINVFKL